MSNHYDNELGWEHEEADMVIGSKSKMKGDIKFEGILRIDGILEGRIISPLESKVIISPSGCYTGDLAGISAAFINGKVIGDINVENLHLGSCAAVHGDIACKTIEIDAGAALVGRLEISPQAMINSEYDECKSIIDDGELDHEREDISSSSPTKLRSSENNFRDEEEEENKHNSPEKLQPRRQHRVVLFIMEPQIDFYPGGKCGIRNNAQDTAAAEVLSDFIYSHMDDIDEIVVTLDAHNRIHVAHSAFWIDKQGSAPAVNTLITMQDLQAGLWRPRKDESMDYCIAILQQLESNQQLYGHRSMNTGGEGGIVIKPDHCLVGSQGASILPVLLEAVGEWGAHTMRNVTYLTRDLTHEGGGHVHLNKVFSASTASHSSGAASHGRHSHHGSHAGDEVQVVGSGSGAGATPHKHEYYDLSFLAQLNEEDKLLICGQSHSLCVEFSLKDVLSAAATVGNIQPENISILKNVTSTAALSAGEEQIAVEEEGAALVEDFWVALSRTGVQITTTHEAQL